MVVVTAEDNKGNSLLPEALANFGNQRIFGGLSSGAQEGSVGFREGGCLETLPHLSLIVINVGHIAIGDYVIHQQFECFSLALEATVKL